jgi:Minichromosome loss protein, Mcl1, middle region
LLAVFYHESEPLRDGTQKIGFTLFNGQNAQTITKGSVSSLSNGALLAWAGFSNDGSLTIMDSIGLVSMLVHSDESSILSQPDSSQWEWIPMLETDRLKKSSDDSYWPISVYDGKLVCIPLKGGTCYPDATRRPITTALGFKMPLASVHQSKG